MRWFASTLETATTLWRGRTWSCVVAALLVVRVGSLMGCGSEPSAGPIPAADGPAAGTVAAHEADPRSGVVAHEGVFHADPGAWGPFFEYRVRTADVLKGGIGLSPVDLAALWGLYAGNRLQPLFLVPGRGSAPAADLLRLVLALHELGGDPHAAGLDSLLRLTHDACQTRLADEDAPVIPALEAAIRRYVNGPPRSVLQVTCENGWWPEDGDVSRVDVALARAWLLAARQLGGATRPVAPAWGGPDGAVQRLVELLPPSHRYFARVVALRRYLGWWVHGGLPVLGSWGNLSPGDFGPRAARLKRRLVAEGWLSAEAAAVKPSLFDEATRQAVLAWREAHGMTVRTKVDRPMLEKLSWEAGQHVAALHRSLASTLARGTERGDAFILVNIPEYIVSFNRGGMEQASYRTVVGFPYQEPGGRTPVISSEIAYIDFNPTWTPTQYVLEHELRPKAAREAGFFKKNRFLEKDGRLVQLPGPENTLGQVNIGFVNDNLVSLHGSPERKYFGYADRAMSHGCIRVEGIEDLAMRIRGFTGDVLEPTLDEVLQRVIERRIVPSKTVPVYVIYDRVRVLHDGRVAVTPDPYHLARRETPDQAVLKPFQTLIGQAKKNRPREASVR
ncbi:MAG: hypothetical protein FJ109_11910 [Deltaproteobacteria bacterium]|nr:hypothetical protein [Deltaproteobacteria bacterium]